MQSNMRMHVSVCVHLISSRIKSSELPFALALNLEVTEMLGSLPIEPKLPITKSSPMWYVMK